MHRVTFGRTPHGPLAAGVYFYRLRAGPLAATRRMLLVPLRFARHARRPLTAVGRASPPRSIVNTDEPGRWRRHGECPIGK
jgi:hypothetical protein